jgi:ankyrin repeat protein
LAFVVDANDMSPMHQSALTDNAASVSLLMKVGARVRCYDRSGHSPLAVACMSGSREAAHAILQQEGVVVNERDVRQRTPLHWAVSSGLASVAEELLERDADLSALDAQGSAPIHDAVHKGDPDTVRVLLRGGADVFMDDAQGALPLHVAAMAGSADACRVLVAHLTRSEAHTFFRLRAKGVYGPAVMRRSALLLIALTLIGVLRSRHRQRPSLYCP